jgi:hypothetical protein
MRSVPPRGSGWVSVAFMLDHRHSFSEPTRYRVVVLTSWARAYRNSGLRTSSSADIKTTPYQSRRLGSILERPGF